MEPTNGVESEATGTGAGAPLLRAASLPARPKLEGEVERNSMFDVLAGSDEENVAGLQLLRPAVHDLRADADLDGPANLEEDAPVFGRYFDCINLGTPLT